MKMENQISTKVPKVQSFVQQEINPIENRCDLGHCQQNEPSAVIDLYINNKAHQFTVPITIDPKGHQHPPSICLLAVLENIYPDSKDGIAIAKLSQVIPREKWASTYLQDKDSLLILTASQGG